jgi:hypothetical protein
MMVTTIMMIIAIMMMTIATIKKPW